MKARIATATSENRQVLGKIIPLQVPFTCDIYPTNVCNFKCIYCAQSIKPDHIRNEFMSWEIFKKCIDDLTHFPYKVKQVLFVGLGEPLAHPEITDMVAYAKKKDVAEKVAIITNGSLLTHDMSDRLIAAGLDHLKVSIQGLNDTKYREMCGTKFSLAQIIENIKYYHQHKNHTEVNVKIVADAFEKESDKETFYEMFGDICDTMNIEYLCPYQEGIDYSTIIDTDFRTQIGGKSKNKICQIPFFRYAVYPDGEIIPCCQISFEAYKQISLGNIMDTDLCEIWNSSRFNKFRLMLLRNERQQNPTCAVCDDFFTSQCQPGDDIDAYAEHLISIYEKMGGVQS